MAYNYSNTGGTTTPPPQNPPNGTPAYNPNDPANWGKEPPGGYLPPRGAAPSTPGTNPTGANPGAEPGGVTGGLPPGASVVAGTPAAGIATPGAPKGRGVSGQDAFMAAAGQGLKGEDIVNSLKSQGYWDSGAYYPDSGYFGFDQFYATPNAQGSFDVHQRGPAGPSRGNQSGAFSGMDSLVSGLAPGAPPMTSPDRDGQAGGPPGQPQAQWSNPGLQALLMQLMNNHDKPTYNV